MFAINNGSTQIPTDMMGADYENAMPAAANEALQMLATAGKFIIKSIDIAHIPVKSLIQGSERIRSIESGTITYEADNARSMYYECKGKGTMSVQFGDNDPVVTEFDDTDSEGYVPHKLAIVDSLNETDTVYDEDKEENQVVIGDDICFEIVTLENVSSVRIEYSRITSPNGRFSILNEGENKYTIVYTDHIDEDYKGYNSIAGSGINTFNCDYVYQNVGSSAEHEGYTLVHSIKAVPRIPVGKATVSFTSDYPLSLKNVGMYSAFYESADDIPPYSEYVRYDLRELAPDYYMVDPEGIIYEGNREVSRYMATSDWFEEGYSILLLKRNMPGNYKIYYKAYPQKITLSTPNTTELVLCPEVAVLLPLYMASQVLKEDNLSLATVYRNEFEVAFERLVKNVESPSQEHFVSVTGWI
jgi:hypothetical protein